MKVRIFPSRDLANAAAAASLADWIASSPTCRVMVAGGNTPLDLYAQIACQKRDLSHLNIFALDEYVGVPLDEPRNCANLLRQTVVQAWGVPQAQFFPISSLESDALASVRAQEQRIEMDEERTRAHNAFISACDILVGICKKPENEIYGVLILALIANLLVILPVCFMQSLE